MLYCTYVLKLIRQSAIDKPWFYRAIMLLIAVAFIVGMGWFGFGSADSSYIALVEDVQISRQEYRQAYQNAFRAYQNMLGEQFKEEDLQKLVINNLVDRLLWLKAADQLKLAVSPQEIVNLLIKDRSFYRKGRFDPEQYRWILKNSRPSLTPERYEASLREDLLLDKIRAVISDGIILTTAEEEETRAMVVNAELQGEDIEKTRNKAVENALRTKKQRAIVNYLISVRAASTVEIQDWLL